MFSMNPEEYETYFGLIEDTHECAVHMDEIRAIEDAEEAAAYYESLDIEMNRW